MCSGGAATGGAFAKAAATVAAGAVLAAGTAWVGLGSSTGVGYDVLVRAGDTTGGPHAVQLSGRAESPCAGALEGMIGDVGAPGALAGANTVSGRNRERRTPGSPVDAADDLRGEGGSEAEAEGVPRWKALSN